MGFLSSIISLFFPPVCAFCKTEGGFLCKKCVHRFRIHKVAHTSKFPSKLEFKHLDGVIYAGDYHKNPELKAAISQFKYRFTKELVDHFADLQARKLEELGMTRRKKVFLVPVPLHKKRLAYRGFNQAELLAHGTAACFGEGSEVRNVLCRIKHTSQQAKLSKKERQKNLSDAFEVKGDLSQLSDRVCFVVDDVCTTGSTLDHCAKVLKENGVKKVYGLVVARAFK